MSQEYEYRVTWQREGQGKVRRFYQTLPGARACAERQRSAVEEMTWLASPLAPIIWGPYIEARKVGPWGSRVLLTAFATEVIA